MCDPSGVTPNDSALTVPFGCGVTNWRSARSGDPIQRPVLDGSVSSTPSKARTGPIRVGRADDEVQRRDPRLGHDVVSSRPGFIVRSDHVPCPSPRWCRSSPSADQRAHGAPSLLVRQRRLVRAIRVHREVAARARLRRPKEQDATVRHGRRRSDWRSGPRDARRRRRSRANRGWLASRMTALPRLCSPPVTTAMQAAIASRRSLTSRHAVTGPARRPVGRHRGTSPGRESSRWWSSGGSRRPSARGSSHCLGC